jgi:predicted O-methyltransferase YrrM|tara:strand:+ start:1721 stop:2380 length:660 start_codon:yes stop_codon:yes gene_type:complete
MNERDDYIKQIIEKLPDKNEKINNKIPIINVIKEGGMTIAQSNYITKFIKDNNIFYIGETGFNSGLGTFTFLSSGTRVTSFDIGERKNIIESSKKTIDDLFPNRHRLILGNSLETLPNYTPEHKFDMAFIDGGHNNDIPYLDAINFISHMKKGSFLFFDDFRNKPGDAIVKAVRKLISEKKAEVVEGPIYDITDTDYEIKSFSHVQKPYKRGYIMMRII